MSNAAILSMMLVAAIFALLAWLTVWSRRADRMRHVAIAAVIIGLPAVATAGIEALSWPRPLWAMWDIGGEVRIIGAKMVKDVAIYVYIDADGIEPRSVALPWDTNAAKQLQDLFDDPANQGQALMRYEWSWERRAPLQFYQPPQPPSLPEKTPEPEAPKFSL